MLTQVVPTSCGVLWLLPQRLHRMMHSMQSVTPVNVLDGEFVAWWGRRLFPGSATWHRDPLNKCGRKKNFVIEQIQKKEEKTLALTQSSQGHSTPGLAARRLHRKLPSGDQGTSTVLSRVLGFRRRLCAGAASSFYRGTCATTIARSSDAPLNSGPTDFRPKYQIELLGSQLT